MLTADRVIIQIGSHVGNTLNDPLFQNVDNSTKLILVEPVPFIFNQLKKNYTDKFPDSNNIIFINKAASSKTGTLELTVPSEKNDFNKLPWYASQLGSVNDNHISGHLDQFIDIPKVITEKITVPAITIDDIVKEHNIKEIDLLHTDTEGHDYDIIMNYSFIVKPKKIMFEHKHMDGFFHHGEKYEKLVSILEKKGYKVVEKGEEDTIMEHCLNLDHILSMSVVTVEERLEKIELMLQILLEKIQ